jgi:hypothetical protein
MDAGVDVSDAGSDVVVDTGIDVPISPLLCGKSTCNALIELCCRTGDPLDASGEIFTCMTDAAACSGLAVVCDEPANCTAQGHPGDVCCAIVPDGGSIANRTACVPQAACKGGLMCQPGDDEMCRFDAGETCKASIATILGWDICKT